MKKVNLSVFLLIMIVVTSISAAFAQSKGITHDRPIDDKWALVIGISKFQDPKIPQLQYAAKDAQDFAEFLSSQGNFAKDHVLLLTDEKATYENIRSALGDSWLPKRALSNDLVVIFASTHGSPKDIDVGKDNWLIAHNTKIGNFYTTGIALTDLAATVKKRTGCDRIVLILDACNSGAAKTGGGKGLIREGNFNINSLAGEGQIIISSSDANQRSWESKRYENGVFTRKFIDSLRIGGLASPLDKVFDTLKTKVEAEVRFDRQASQTPVFKSEWKGKQVALMAPPVKPRATQAPKLFSTTSSATGTSNLNSNNNSSTARSLGKQAHALLDDKDDEKAYKIAKRGMDGGDLLSQAILARMYYFGRHVQTNRSKALQLVKMPADADVPMAVNLLGLFYEDGGMVTKDTKKALLLFQKSSELGYTAGTYNLGRMYNYGGGIRKNRKKALELFLKAAEKEYPLAYLAIGNLYLNGKGVRKDYKLAYKWYRKGALVGNMDCQNNVGFMYQNGYGTDKNMDEAVKWYKRAAAQGNYQAMKNLKALGL